MERLLRCQSRGSLSFNPKYNFNMHTNKKFGLLAGILCLAASASQAWGAVMEIGYCHGEVSSQTLSKVGNCDVSAAVVLTPEMLKPYVGADITGIRLYLATTDNLVDITAWVRGDINGDNLAEGEGAVKDGWQTVALDKPLKVASTPIAIGYTFHQTKTSKCIALGGDIVPEGHYYAKRGEWETPSDPAGSICVELVVEGEQVADADLGVEKMSLESPVAKIGEPIIMKAKVRNTSLSVINGFSYSVHCPIMNHLLIEGNCTDGIEPKQAVEIELNVSTEGFPINEQVPLTFEIMDDGYDGNNLASTVCGIYDEAFPHTLLMEEFTTEECPNCPRAITSIATALENGYDEDMIVVAHHVGFYTDWLTIPEESALLWLYGDDGSFAPAGMYDRTIRAADLKTPVESIGYYDTFSSRLDEAIGKPGFVKVDVQAQASDLFIDVSVEAEAHPLLKTMLADPYLTVLLTESGIRHHRQAGISNPEFTHSHASRAYLTEVFGNRVEFDSEGRLHWNGKIECANDWNCDNMEAVAFIHAYDPSDRTACEVYNVAASHLLSSGVTSISSSTSENVRYFDLQGRALTQPGVGVSIKVEIQEDGSLLTTKVMR